MASGVLHDVSMGYQLLWGPQRKVAGVQLRMDLQSNTSIDARHLLGTLGKMWRTDAPPLQLCTSSVALLADLLDMAPAKQARIEVSDAQLRDPAIAARVVRAGQRGLSLVWRGEPGTRFKAAYTSSFTQSILGLSTDEALMSLRIAKRSQGANLPADPASPVRAGQIYEGVASQLLAEHVLGQQGAAALLGWPVEDVLYGYRQHRIQPGRAAIMRLVEAIDADIAMEDIEQLLAQDALLAYRFLRYVNSAGAGLRREIDALRQGLMVLGLGRVKTWLQEQLPKASSDRNLHPVRLGMTLRAQLMAETLDAGEGDALKRELHLCGLLSQIDQLLAEPLTSALGSVPLPARVIAALVDHDGPYWPYLAIACALESPGTASQSLCERHGIDQEAVNQALLRTLCTATRPLH